MQTPKLFSLVITVFNAVAISFVLLVFCINNQALADVSLSVVNTAEKYPSDKLLSAEPRKQRQQVLPYRLPPAEVYLDNPSAGVGPTVFVRKIRAKGNKRFTAAQLQPLFAAYENQELSLATMELLRTQVTYFYVSQGYVNSGALIREQNIEHGELVLSVVEGQLSEVVVKGLEHLKAPYIKQRFQSLQPSILSINTIREQLYLLQSDPLIGQIKAQLLPSDDIGEAALLVQVLEQRAFYYDLNLNNYRVPSTGQEYASLRIGHLNLTGHGDSLEAGVGTSEGASDVSLRYSTPYRYSDTRFGLAFNAVESEVISNALDKRGLKIESQFLESSLFLSAPLWRFADNELILDFALQLRQSETLFNGEGQGFADGAPPDGITKATVLRFSQQWTKRDLGQALVLRSSFSQGLDALGADTRSYEGVNAQFTAWLGQLQWLRYWGSGHYETLVRGSSQWVDDAVLSMEKFAAGGRWSTRGFSENEMVRDKGWQATFELRYQLAPLVNGLDLKLLCFSDNTELWDRSTETGRQSLGSVGIGMLGKWSDSPSQRWQFELFIAEAIKNETDVPSSGLQGDGVHFSIWWGSL